MNSNKETKPRTEYEHHYLAMKKWNDNRAVNEKRGLEQFYKLKEIFRNQNTISNENRAS